MRKEIIVSYCWMPTDWLQEERVIYGAMTRRKFFPSGNRPRKRWIDL